MTNDIKPASERSVLAMPPGVVVGVVGVAMARFLNTQLVHTSSGRSDVPWIVMIIVATVLPVLGAWSFPRVPTWGLLIINCVIATTATLVAPRLTASPRTGGQYVILIAMACIAAAYNYLLVLPVVTTTRFVRLGVDRPSSLVAGPTALFAFCAVTIPIWYHHEVWFHRHLLTHRWLATAYALVPTALLFAWYLRGIQRDARSVRKECVQLIVRTIHVPLLLLVMEVAVLTVIAAGSS